MKTIVVILLVLLASPVWGATYYLRADGTDADPDCSESSACCAGALDASDFSGDTFSPGDIINVCDDGGVIRETLTVPSSGSEGNPITIQAASGDSPVISGADLISTWSSTSLDLDDDFTDNDITDYSTSENISASGGIVVTVIESAAGDYGRMLSLTSRTEVWASLDIKMVSGYSNVTNGDYSFGPGIIHGSTYKTLNMIGYTHNGGTIKWSCRYGTDASAASGISTTTITEDVWHNVVLYWKAATGVGADDGIVRQWVDDVLIYEKTDIDSDTLTSDAFAIGSFGASDQTLTWHQDNVKRGPVGSVPDDMWSATVTTDPSIVLFDGELGNEETYIITADTEYDWWWDDDVLYVYAASDPDALYTSPGIESGARTYGLNTSNRSYITVDGIEIYGAQYFGIANQSNGTVDGIIFQNLVTHHNAEHGIYLDQQHATEVTTGVTIDDNVTHSNGKDGISTRFKINELTITDNTVYDNGWVETYFSAGIHLYGGQEPADTRADDILVENNTVYGQIDSPSTHPISPGIGIWIDTQGTNVIVRYNNVYDNEGSGIMTERTTGTQIYYNITHGNGSPSAPADEDGGILVYRYNGECKVYNNVAYGNSNGIMLLGEDADDRGMVDHEVKNNISIGNTGVQLGTRFGAENDGVMGSGNIYLNNCLGVEEASFIEWGDDNYDSTYDDWETSYGGTTSSLEADPSFVNASSGNFQLQSTSPAIDTGTDVSLTPDYYGNPVPRGDGVDIGAHERPVDRGLKKLYNRLRLWL